MKNAVARDEAVLWHPYTQHAIAPAPLPVTEAHGSWLTLAGGRRILDGISSWWTCLHGHTHPRIVEAIRSQARTLDHCHFAGLTHEPAIALAERLVLAAPPGLTRVFYGDDGSTAVEAALKMALAYHARRGAPRRTRFLALEHAYHGDTVGAMSVSAAGPFTASFRPLLFEAVRTPIPHDGRPGLPGPGLADCRETLAALLAREGDTFAALVVEPLLMGAGGMLLTPPAYLRALRELTAAHGILLIADEIFTGFGRTGTLFACAQASVTPDLMCLSKALTGGVLPLAATLATEELYAAFRSSSPGDAFLHGHSYTANPIACAAALASLDLLDELALARGRAIGERLEAGLAPLAGLPGCLPVRGLGPVRAIEIETGDDDGYLAEAGRVMAAAALDHDVLLRPLGNVLYALPPLSTTDEEVDRIASATAHAVRAGLAW